MPRASWKARREPNCCAVVLTNAVREGGCWAVGISRQARASAPKTEAKPAELNPLPLRNAPTQMTSIASGSSACKRSSAQARFAMSCDDSSAPILGSCCLRTAKRGNDRTSAEPKAHRRFEASRGFTRASAARSLDEVSSATSMSSARNGSLCMSSLCEAFAAAHAMRDNQFTCTPSPLASSGSGSSPASRLVMPPTRRSAQEASSSLLPAPTAPGARYGSFANRCRAVSRLKRLRPRMPPCLSTV
mmetsp:Transcript_103826/g.298289  ORF Transcript_103826/g.298289 Transcript_103826/m.298289 type:complete len:246 (+) Transcript_103826:656-1393(+)